MATEREETSGRWWTLGAVCVATLMLLLDITIVNVALPDIARDLRYLDAFTSALNDLFLVGAGVAFAGALLSVALIRRRHFVAHARA